TTDPTIRDRAPCNKLITRTPATMHDEGLANAKAANPFRLPRLPPAIESGQKRSVERHNLDLCGHRVACARDQPHHVLADVRGLHADKAGPAVLADIPHGARAVAPGIPYDGGVRTPLFDAEPPRQHGIIDHARRRRVEKDAIRFAGDPQRL